MDLHAILDVAAKGGASDIHLKAGLPPLFRISGGLVPLKNGPRLSPQDLDRIASHMMAAEQKERFEKTRDIDFSYSVPRMGRFRVNVFRQRNVTGVVMRVIASEVKSVEELMLPKVLEKIATEKRGIVLVTGATGSGKSTTLAALINEINSKRSAHILTVEDPIEFMFRDKRSVVNQREIGQDTKDFAAALRASLRQDPDVILVGEMRDMETVETALTAAETGHLVLSTLHTIDAAETVNRIISFFPPHQHHHVRGLLSANLKAVCSQRLVKTVDGKGRVAAMEVMVTTGRIREIISEEGRSAELRDAISQGTTSYGMQTFDQALMDLLQRGLISRDEALNHCTNKDDFLLRLSGVQGSSDGRWEGFE